MVHAGVGKSHTGLCEWPTSSVQAHQEFSSQALSSFSILTILYHFTHLLCPPPFSLSIPLPSSTPTLLSKPTLSPPLCFHVIQHPHRSTPLSVVSSICDVAQAESQAQAPRLLGGRQPYPHFSFVRNYTSKCWHWGLFKWVGVMPTTHIGSVDK